MKLISRQRDYYDSVQAHGYDTHVTYLRKRAEFNYSVYRKEWTQEHVKVVPPAGVPELWAAVTALICCKDVQFNFRLRGGISFGLFVVGGRLYPCAREYEDGKVVHWHYEAAGVMAAVDADRSKLPAWRQRIQKLSKEQVEAFFALRGSDIVLPLAIQHAVVCAFVRPSYIVVDPILAESEVFKTLTPYEAAQNIEMLLGNIAQPERPIVVIADKYKVASHGFTSESFRNTGGRLKGANK